MRVKWKLIIGFSLGFFIVFKNPAHCEQRKLERLERPQVILTVSKRVCLAPCELDIRVHIARHEGNRYLYIAWGSDESYYENNSSLISLDGENSEQSFERKAVLAPGEYLIVAVLYRKVLKGDKEEVEQFEDSARVLVQGGDG